MSFTPAILPLVVMQEGGNVFPCVAGWIDSVKSTSSVATYNVAAARTAMGLASTAALFVIFAADGPFWANFRNTAVIPTGATADGSASEYSPNQRYLDSTITSISLISPASQLISLQFFRP